MATQRVWPGTKETQTEIEHLCEYNLPSIACVKLGAGPHVVKLISPDEWKADSLVAARRIKGDLNSKNRIWTQAEFAEAPPGVYVWLMANKNLYAVRVRSELEFGTKHRQLAFRVGASEILVAGECEISRVEGGAEKLESALKGSKVDLNLYSGTYVKRLVEEGYNTADILEPVQEAFEAIFGKGAVTVNTKIKTFIRSEKVQLTTEELDEYVAMGFKVKIYKNREDCLKESQLFGRICFLEHQKRLHEAGAFPYYGEAQETELAAKRRELETLGDMYRPRGRNRNRG